MNAWPTRHLTARRALAVLALTGAALSAAQTPPAEPVPVENAALVALVSGQRLHTDNVQWGPVQLQFRENGTLYGNNKGSSDSGKWRVEGSTLCLEWRRWDYAGCGLVQRVGDRYQHLWPNGTLHFTFQP
ncbi:hypothetical protein [Aquabacterium sp. A08]|uniref:hypothetical protein n=1 Tax=Aquabacterium sp. A08 TaxID=2718532 RepID=UPI001422BED9|nr:hypothetical protein [Aquabacterium sp. A08]NIC39642.1 hypothetical protein [Aquabacterium sp. A08]